MQLQKNNTTFKTKDQSNTRLDVIICVLLIVATLGVYWQIKTHDFIGYDDDNYINCGSAFFAQGKIEESFAYYQALLKSRSGFAGVQHNFGILLLKTGRIDEAVVHFEEELREY